MTKTAENRTNLRRQFVIRASSFLRHWVFRHSSFRTDAVIEHAFAVELAPRDPGQTFADVNVGARIAAALAARRIGKCETLVAVGRSSIELRRLSLPPAPPEDLPDMVRFQAMRDFTGVGEDWPLDYVPLDAAPADSTEASGSIGVLAAVIAPKLVEQIRETCEAAGLTPERLVLRPFAAASLLRRARPSGECRLLVDLLGDEADLTVVIGGNVVFVRTVRLPVDDDAQTRALLGEARRTIAAAQNQLGGRRVERLVVCGESDRVAAVESLVEEQLAIPAEAFDPFSAVEIDGDLKAGLPDRSGRFAPLLGMLSDEAAQARHDIDFLNPRRRPKAVSPHRRYAVIGGAAAAVFLAAALLVWNHQKNKDREIRALQSEVKNLDAEIAKYRKVQSKTEDIDAFAAGDITWLDELKEVSQELPPADRILVNRLTTAVLPAGVGVMTLNGYARNAADTTTLVQNLQNDRRQVSSKGANENSPRSDYPWRFDGATIRVPPRPIAEETGAEE
jgi:Tfp pilus assembly PilM family ATPase/Tfp pilus assembly protein PilN